MSKTIEIICPKCNEKRFITKSEYRDKVKDGHTFYVSYVILELDMEKLLRKTAWNLYIKCKKKKYRF